MKDRQLRSRITHLNHKINRYFRGNHLWLWRRQEVWAKCNILYPDIKIESIQKSIWEVKADNLMMIWMQLTVYNQIDFMMITILIYTIIKKINGLLVFKVSQRNKMLSQLLASIFKNRSQIILIIPMLVILLSLHQLNSSHLHIREQLLKK
jgi:hypothetical protein